MDWINATRLWIGLMFIRLGAFIANIPAPAFAVKDIQRRRMLVEGGLRRIPNRHVSVRLS